MQYYDSHKQETVTTMANEDILFKLVQCDSYDKFKVKWKNEFKSITYYGKGLYDDIIVRLTDKEIENG